MYMYTYIYIYVYIYIYIYREREIYIHREYSCVSPYVRASRVGVLFCLIIYRSQYQRIMFE